MIIKQRFLHIRIYIEKQLVETLRVSLGCWRSQDRMLSFIVSTSHTLMYTYISRILSSSRNTYSVFYTHIHTVLLLFFFFLFFFLSCSFCWTTYCVVGAIAATSWKCIISYKFSYTTDLDMACLVVGKYKFSSTWQKYAILFFDYVQETIFLLLFFFYFFYFFFKNLIWIKIFYCSDIILLFFFILRMNRIVEYNLGYEDNNFWSWELTIVVNIYLRLDRTSCFSSYITYDTECCHKYQIIVSSFPLSISFTLVHIYVFLVSLCVVWEREVEPSSRILSIWPTLFLCQRSRGRTAW